MARGLQIRGTGKTKLSACAKCCSTSAEGKEPELRGGGSRVIGYQRSLGPALVADLRVRVGADRPSTSADGLHSSEPLYLPF